MFLLKKKFDNIFPFLPIPGLFLYVHLMLFYYLQSKTVSTNTSQDGPLTGQTSVAPLPRRPPQTILWQSHGGQEVGFHLEFWHHPNLSSFLIYFTFSIFPPNVFNALRFQV